MTVPNLSNFQSKDLGFKKGDSIRVRLNMGFNLPATSYTGHITDSDGHSQDISDSVSFDETFNFKGYYRYIAVLVFVGGGSGQPATSITPGFTFTNFTPPTHTGTRRVTLTIDGGNPTTPSYLEELHKLDRYSNSQYIPPIL